MYLTSEYQIYEGHMQIKNLGQEMVFLKEKKNKHLIPPFNKV